MGRGYSVPSLAFAGLCLFMMLLAEHTRAYPYRIDKGEGNVEYLSTVPKSKTTVNTERPFLQTFEKSRQDDEKRFVDSNGRLTGRVRRYAPSASTKRLLRSFSDSSDEDMLSDGKIVFPGEEIRLQVPSCKGATYCESVDSYPKDLVNNAIRVNESLRYLAGVDVVSDVIQRIDAMDDVPLCLSTEQVIFPQSGENKENQWKFIANQDNFKQGVRIEKCSNENVSCSMIGGAAEGYKTSCKQKYVYRQLASVLSDGTLVPDTFRFPSSCCCHASFTGNPYTRMGIITDSQGSQVTPVKTSRRQ